MDILDEIIDLKRKRVEAAKLAVDWAGYQRSARKLREECETFALSRALRHDRVNVIAEIKRASPSKGIINRNIDVAEVARSYESGGAAAVSVLTEEDKFLGRLEDLEAVRREVRIPILRKDFVFDEFQIAEAAIAGADAILLIVAMLDDHRLRDLHEYATGEYSLDALVEVHSEEELDRALATGAGLIGVNNRNLRTFEVSLDTSRKLIRGKPEGVLMVAESGISTKAEIAELRGLGFDGFLVGESLMRSADSALTLESWK